MRFVQPAHVIPLRSMPTPSMRSAEVRWRVVLLGGVVIVAPVVPGLTTVAATRSEALAGLLAVVAVVAFGWCLWHLADGLWPRFGRGRSLVVLVLGLVLALGAFVPALLSVYVLTTTAGLCGDGRADWLVVPFSLAAYLIVASWGLRSPWRLPWAWPLGVLSAAAVAVLVSYVDPGAHGFCETSTPNESSVPAGAFDAGDTMYSAALTLSSPPLRRNVA